jgi:FxsC-like protein
MSHWFFLSYAHDNSDKYLERFHRDLNERIHLLTSPREGEEGFIDTKNIELGSRFPYALTTALQNCKTFVPLYSPAYFTKENCGREWQIFNSRQEAYFATLPANTSRPSLILPVLWVPESRLPSPLPDAVLEFQYKHGDFGDEYAKQGLRGLMQRSTTRDKYHKFLTHFADHLIEVASAYTLPPLSQVRPFEEIESAFHPRGRAIGQSATASNGGPRESKFVFVAGRRDELRGIREKLDHYGEVGGFDWRPFSPEFVEEVGIMAQKVASREKLHYRWLEFDKNIFEKLKEAALDNKIVVIVIDTWTLKIPRYEEFLKEYDSRNFVNCVVLVPWNSKDDETVINRSHLVNRMWGALGNHAVKPDPSCFRDSICSPEELKKELSSALNKARARISAKAEVVRRAESEQPFGTPPTITGVR